jgi:RNA polymerase sigma-70 factor, ECF subfamily
MLSAASASGTPDVSPPAAPPSLEATYDAYFPVVWRSVQRLGVPTAQADDVVQEVFLVVHRKLEGFEGRSSLKTWLYGITLRVARAYRAKHRLAGSGGESDLDALPGPADAQPDRAHGRR